MKNLNTPFIIWMIILGKTSEKCQLTMNTLKSNQQSRRSKNFTRKAFNLQEMHIPGSELVCCFSAI